MVQESIKVVSEPVAPLVTVGMATYNNPEGLKDALNCIVNQTYKNLEIIVSDDCSPDQRTRDVINEFQKQDNRIRSVRQQTNLGPPANLNFVLTQATGQYFMWADDDDLRDARWIEVLLPKLFNKSAVASLGKVVSIDERGNPTRNWKPIQFTGPRSLRLANYYLTEESSGKACITCGLFRTDFVRKLKPWGQYEINKFGFGDNYFGFDCLQYGDVITDQSVTIYKREPQGDKHYQKNIRNLTVLSRIFIGIKYAANYIRVASKLSDKTIILVLFPIKCIKSFAFYIVRKARS